MISVAIANEVASGGHRRFDKRGELFYDQISALHKSVRDSDPDAALYWLCRMLDGGCDPAFIARRMVRMASEDIGNADPRALTLALAARDSYDRLAARRVSLRWRRPVCSSPAPRRAMRSTGPSAPRGTRRSWGRRGAVALCAMRRRG